MPAFRVVKKVCPARLELFDSIHRHVIDVSVLHRPDHADLDFDRNRAVLGLLEQLDDALPAIDLRLRRGIQLRAELRERRQLPKLCEVSLELPGHLLHGLELRGRAHPRHRDSNRDRGSNALIEQVGLEKDLPIRDGDDVSGNVGGHVARLGFDDRQGGERTVAVLFAHARRALEQPAVEVEHVARVGFSTRWAFQHEGHLTVGHGVLGQIVIDNQCVHAVVHEPLANCGARKRSQVLTGRRIRRGRRDDDAVRQCASFFENAHNSSDGRLFLADRHVNAVERTITPVARRFSCAIESRLADDRVDADSGFTRRAIPNDQFALTAADRNHRVDGHDAGLHRLTHRPALDDSRGEFFDRVRDVTRNGAFRIQRLTERVDDAAQQALANRHLQQLPRRTDFVSLLKLCVVAENDHADLGLVEIQREAGNAAAEVEHFVQHHIGEALDAGDAVANLANHADTLFDGRCLQTSDLGFDFLNEISHVRSATHNRSSNAASLARTLPSYTSPPTLMRTPPMSRGFSSNEASSPGP